MFHNSHNYYYRIETLKTFNSLCGYYNCATIKTARQNKIEQNRLYFFEIKNKKDEDFLTTLLECRVLIRFPKCILSNHNKHDDKEFSDKKGNPQYIDFGKVQTKTYIVKKCQVEYYKKGWKKL